MVEKKRDVSCRACRGHDLFAHVPVSSYNQRLPGITSRELDGAFELAGVTLECGRSGARHCIVDIWQMNDADAL